jgi:hypothetical protein
MLIRGKIAMALLDDKRPIKMIGGTEDGMPWAWEAPRTCERIEVYGEWGTSGVGLTPWFAIYKDGEISQRINSAFVESVTY